MKTNMARDKMTTEHILQDNPIYQNQQKLFWPGPVLVQYVKRNLVVV